MSIDKVSKQLAKLELRVKKQKITIVLLSVTIFVTNLVYCFMFKYVLTDINKITDVIEKITYLIEIR